MDWLHRERDARSRPPSTLCSQRPGLRKDPGLFCFPFNLFPARLAGCRRDPRIAAPLAANALSQFAAGCLRYWPVAIPPSGGCSLSRQSATFPTSRPRVRSSSSAPLRVCPCTPLPREMALAARDVRDTFLVHVQRDTTSDGMLAFGHSRSGFIALVAQPEEQPPCKRPVARSNRRRGHQTCRVRLAGPGRRTFNPGTRVRIPHATPAQGTLVELTLRGWKSAATIGRRRNP